MDTFTEEELAQIERGTAALNANALACQSNPITNGDCLLKRRAVEYVLTAEGRAELLALAERRAPVGEANRVSHK